MILRLNMMIFSSLMMIGFVLGYTNNGPVKRVSLSSIIASLPKKSGLASTASVAQLPARGWGSQPFDLIPPFMKGTTTQSVPSTPQELKIQVIQRRPSTTILVDSPPSSVVVKKSPITIESASAVAVQKKSTVLSRWRDRYMAALENRPLLTKASTAAVVSMVGDLISQFLTALVSLRFSSSSLDLTRMLCFGLVGFFYNAPLCHVWYKLVAKFGKGVQRTHKLTDGQRVVAELTLDQTIGVLLYYPLYFYVYEFFSALLQVRSFQFLPLTIRAWVPIVAAIRAQYAVWPFTQYFSFRFVPESLRVLIGNLVEVVWNIYFCARVAAT